MPPRHSSSLLPFVADSTIGELAAGHNPDHGRRTRKADRDAGRGQDGLAETQQEFPAGPGDVVYVPLGTRPAQRRVVPRVGRTLSMFSPAGFEGFFREISRADSRGTLDEAEMDRITQRYGAVWVP